MCRVDACNPPAVLEDIRLCFGISLAVWLLACNDSPDTLTGSWIGGFSQDVQERAGTITMSLTQSGRSLAGRWEIEIETHDVGGVIVPVSPPLSPWGGSLEGTVNGTSLEARLKPDNPEVCPYRWNAIHGGDRIQGAYVAFGARCQIQGRIDVRRQ
jgi:hypothetical protein